MNGWITRAVAGREKVLQGFLAVTQVYIGALSVIGEPHKAYIIGIIGVVQYWLTADSVPSLPGVTASVRSAAAKAMEAIAPAAKAEEPPGPRPRPKT